jgi:hypothetical protein
MQRLQTAVHNVTTIVIYKQTYFVVHHHYTSNVGETTTHKDRTEFKITSRRQDILRVLTGMYYRGVNFVLEIKI